MIDGRARPRGFAVGRNDHSRAGFSVRLRFCHLSLERILPTEAGVPHKNNRRRVLPMRTLALSDLCKEARIAVAQILRYLGCGEYEFSGCGSCCRGNWTPRGAEAVAQRDVACAIVARIRPSSVSHACNFTARAARSAESSSSSLSSVAPAVWSLSRAIARDMTT
eukprot:scaffold91366_cov27-Tisochrysis_lutea.AAC.1